jgi:hypothetical protein
MDKGSAHKPQATSHKPQATSHKPQATSHKPQATSHKPQNSDRYLAFVKSPKTITRKRTIKHIDDKVFFYEFCVEFLKLIQKYRKKVKTQEQKNTQKWIENHLFIYGLVRYSSEQIGQENGVLASEAAQKKYEEMGGTGLIKQFKRKDQTTEKGLKDPGRKIFHAEHLIPVLQLGTQLLNILNPTKELIKKEFKKEHIAWLTKCESTKIDKTEYGKNRKNPIRDLKKTFGITIS